MTTTTKDPGVMNPASQAASISGIFEEFTPGTSFRLVLNKVLSLLCIALALATFVPLFSIIYLLVIKGWKHLGIATFTQLPPAPGMAGGGIGNAIVGTGILVAIAMVMAAPLGIFAAIYISEYSKYSKLANAVRFTAKLLTGLPSIICGVFAYAMVVVTTGKFSAVAGGVALAVLSLPTILLTSEQALLNVPKTFREASQGLGATTFQTIWKVVLPEAFPAMMTGMMLAIARAAGETAPVLFTSLFNSYWSKSIMQPTASLSVLIYNFSSVPYPNMVELAWTASLVLVIIVTITNVLSQLAFSRK